MMELKKRRPLRGLVNRQKEQTGKAILAAYFGLMPLVLFLIVTSRSMFDVIKMLEQNHRIDVEAAEIFYSAIEMNLIGILVFAILYTLYCVWVSFRLTHQIYGPLVPIGRHLKKMIDGNFEGQIQLRKKDELQDLARDLNELTKVLRETHNIHPTKSLTDQL